MNASLPGRYAGSRNTTMTFPTDRMIEHRYGGVLMEDELCGSAGISAHFWVYPGAPVKRLQAAVIECGYARDLVRWTWDFIPKEHLPQILHDHLRQLLLTGRKDSSYLYFFKPEHVLMMGEIYDVYKALWHTHAASPVGSGELLYYPRQYAKKQIEEREARNKERPDVVADERLFMADVQVKELEWLLNISNDIIAATSKTGVHTRKKAVETEARRIFD